MKQTQHAQLDLCAFECALLAPRLGKLVENEEDAGARRGCDDLATGKSLEIAQPALRLGLCAIPRRDCREGQRSTQSQI